MSARPTEPLLLRLTLALLVGLPLGAWTAWQAIRSDIGIGALSVGPWTAWPDEGSRDADPYTKAKVAAQGAVPLGIGEGVAFEADRDAAGRPLDARCDYRLAGRTPKARIWTLTAHGAARDADGGGSGDGAEGPALKTPDGRLASLTSRDLVRAETGAFELSLGGTAAPGNWLAIDPAAAPERRTTNGAGRPMRLVLRFYDSPVSTSAELFEPTMPVLERVRCDRGVAA